MNRKTKIVLTFADSDTAKTDFVKDLNMKSVQKWY